MIQDHFNCDCLECVDSFNKGFQQDNADPAKDAAYYTGSKLVARKALKVYSSPSVAAPVVKAYEKGANVGIIYSWVVRDGFLWWQIDWFSGKPQGFVLHDPALFDYKIVQDTASGKTVAERNKAIEEAINNDPLSKLGKGVGDVLGGVGDSIGFFGGNLKWILLVVIVVALAYAYKSFKT